MAPGLEIGHFKENKRGGFLTLDIQSEKGL
jgi:hypothetical protein